MRMPAVEELIALGADVGVTISQQRAEAWSPGDAPCKLSQNGAENFWDCKMRSLCLPQLAPEAVRDSLFGIIHLAVSDRHPTCTLLHSTRSIQCI